jgi:VanZ family protein
MSRFIAWSPWPNPYASDKQLHFLGGSIITFIGSVLHYNTTVCILTCGIIALMKEVYDYYSPSHSCELADWVATVAGGIAGLIILRPLVMLLGFDFVGKS